MKIPNLLEQYLVQLDRELISLPVSDKAEIILELRTHILEALHEKGAMGEGSHQDQMLTQILTSFESPKEMAKKYLQERGLDVGSSSSSSSYSPSFSSSSVSSEEKFSWKKLFKFSLKTIGAGIAIIMVFILLLLFKFTPLVQIDEHGVNLLGGAIQISE